MYSPINQSWTQRTTQSTSWGINATCFHIWVGVGGRGWNKFVTHLTTTTIEIGVATCSSIASSNFHSLKVTAASNKWFKKTKTKTSSLNSTWLGSFSFSSLTFRYLCRICVDCLTHFVVATRRKKSVSCYVPTTYTRFSDGARVLDKKKKKKKGICELCVCVQGHAQLGVAASSITTRTL